MALQNGMMVCESCVAEYLGMLPGRYGSVAFVLLHFNGCVGSRLGQGVFIHLHVLWLWWRCSGVGG
jgi:hypothetical protein